jgi:Uma2 family endonuclease
VNSVQITPVVSVKDKPARRDAARKQRAEIVYPESDGKPMADNTKQFRYIVTIHAGLTALFASQPDVFIAGDLLWYPVEGNNRLRMAPDTMVAFGRPQGDRGSYLQWREEGIAPQVVFEILSPGNRAAEMDRKYQFYDHFGVEEYYIYDPDRGLLRGWLRGRHGLQPIAEMLGWVSPRLGIRFMLDGDELVLYRPDGARFETYLELQERADAERVRAETERHRAETERSRAETERSRAEHERSRADAERARADRLAAQLRALGVDPAEAA